MTLTHEWEEFLQNDHKISREIWEKRGIYFDTDYLYIPIYGQNGNLLYTKKRKEPTFKDSNKYLNASGVPTTLYPFDILDKTDQIILCEGELDVLTLESQGIAAVTSTGGVQTFKTEFIQYFKGKKVFICFDNDGAGKDGAERVAEILKNEGIEVKIIDLPEITWEEEDE